MQPAEIDEIILKSFFRNMHNTEVVINFHTAVGLVIGIVLTNDRTLLKEDRGTTEFIVGRCQSIFKRLNIFRRKSTTAKPLIAPGLIKEIGFSFYKEIYKLVKWFNIPKELVINIDQNHYRLFLSAVTPWRKKAISVVPLLKQLTIAKSRVHLV